MRLAFGINSGVLVYASVIASSELRFQAWIVSKVPGETEALLFDRQSPGTASQVRLIPPFQQMDQQHSQTTDQLAPLASPMLSISSAIFSISSSDSRPARSSAACSLAQA